MKNKGSFQFIIFLLVIHLCAGYILAAQQPVTFSDARVQGMGNTFVAIADDKNMLFFNPAGFASYGLMEQSKLAAIKDPTLWRPRYSNIGDITIASVTVGASGFAFEDLLILAEITDDSYSDPWFQLLDMNFFNKFIDGTLTASDVSNANNSLLSAYSTIVHPSVNAEFLSMARHYFGFGVFFSSDIVIKLDPTQGLLNIPNIQAQVHADLIFPFGIGMPIPGYKNWHAGITLKYFHRLSVELNDLTDYLEVVQWVEGDYFKSDFFDTQSIMNMLIHGIDYTKAPIDQIKAGTGYGFDLGLMYRPSFAWKVGLLLSDVYTRINWWDRTEPSSIPINARVGVAWTPRWSFIGLFEDPILAVDVEDLFHQQEKNFFLKWHFGSELKFLWRFFSLRFGINEGYPSYGVGIDLSLQILSRLPVLRWLRPDRIYFPKFDPRDKEFVQKNPLCCCLTGLLAPIFYAHLKIDLSYTGYELGIQPGDLKSY
ncbi:MAG: hypothetical protein KKH98_08750, partial [Spirochaetes bacterium]|nr:hypothetical protein [Spirochaetota bacterium]